MRTVTVVPAVSVAGLRSLVIAAAVPAPAPTAPPIAAPLPPPRMAPRIAPPIAAPPTFAALSPPGDSPSRTTGSVFSATCVPSARTMVWKRIARRALPFMRPPRSTSVTEPRTVEPAGIAMRSVTRTSRVTRASTLSSTRASSLDTVRSICRPSTASDGTVRSTNSGAGGGGGSGSLYSGTDGCTLGRVSHIEPDVLGPGAGVAGAGGSARATGRASRGAGRDATGAAGASAGRTSARRPGALARVAGRDTAGGASGRAGLTGSGEMTPSDSVTGALGAAGAEVPSEAPGTTAPCALSAPIAPTEAWFCRTARYEPPAAAVRHPTDNPAKTSLLNSISIELLGQYEVEGLPAH